MHKFIGKEVYFLVRLKIDDKIVNGYLKDKIKEVSICKDSRNNHFVLENDYPYDDYEFKFSLQNIFWSFDEEFCKKQNWIYLGEK